MLRKVNSNTSANDGEGAAPVRRARTKKNTAAASPGPSGAGAAGNTQPDQEAIARLAYSYWEARGQQGGSSEEDWLRAEAELKQRRAMAAKAG